MKTSQAGINFVAKNEGLTLKIKDDVGHLMIGYGHDLLPGESFPNGITTLQAMTLLEEDIAKADAALNRQNLTGVVNQNQWDALADFAYNAGNGALIQLLAHGIENVPTQLLRWVHAGTKVLPRLVARRDAEIALFNS